MPAKLRDRWSKGDTKAIHQAVKNYNKQLAVVRGAVVRLDKELEKLGNAAWDNLPLDDDSFPDEVMVGWGDLDIAGKLEKYDKRIEKQVTQYLGGSKRATIKHKGKGRVVTISKESWTAMDKARKKAKIPKSNYRHFEERYFRQHPPKVKEAHY
jgi:hypothetical protein